MVAILIHRIRHDTRMKHIWRRHKESNDRSPEEVPSMRSAREDVRKRQQPPDAAAEEDSRDQDPHHAAQAAAAASPQAAAAQPLTTVITAASRDMTYNKTPSFEQRDEHRSAFSPVQHEASVDPPPQESKQDGSQEQEQEQEASSSTPMPMPHPVHLLTDAAERQDPLPYRSPTRYYQPREEGHQDHRAGGGEAADAEAGTAAHQVYHHHYHHQGYPYHQDPHSYDYSSGYYPPPPPPQSDRDADASAPHRGPYHHHHPAPYPGYYPSHQEYAHYPSGYGQPYSYYPSPTTSGGQQQHPAPAYPAARHDPHQQGSHRYYYPGTGTTSPPPWHTPDRAATPPTTAVVTTEGAAATTAREGSDPSSPPSRKPSAEGVYEPIPLHQIAALPVLSASSARRPPSPEEEEPPVQHRDAFHDAFPGRTAAPGHPRASSPPPPPREEADDGAADDGDVAPPVPRSSARPRRPQRTLAPSGGSVVGSPGTASAEGGGSWERRYRELLAFRREHGHCEVPQNYAENTSLGTWVNKQRMEHKNRIEGKNSSLNDSRLERLEGIDFRWAKRKGQASWDEKFKELVAYKARFGNCHVPTKYKANTALGRWVSTQRAEYKKYQEGQAKTSMNADKVRRLEGIGFAWFMAL